MKNENYTCAFTVNTPPNKIVETICDVHSWWANDVKGSSKKLNDVFTVRFGKTYGTFKITDFIPSKKIVWLVTECYLPLFQNKTQWLGTQIIWVINANGNTSTLIMTHIGLTPEAECYTDCKNGWNFYVGESLFNMITKGKGSPGTGIFTHITTENKRYEGLLYAKNDALPGSVGEYYLIDVKETQGERITAIYSVEKLDKNGFNANNLKGEYYMLIENKSVYENMQLLEDIQQMIKPGKLPDTA